MRYRELTETISRFNVLFHFTGMAVLLRVIQENRLQAARLLNADAATISFTRNSIPGSGSRLGLPYDRAAACLIFNASKITTEPHAGDVGKRKPYWKEMEERHNGDLQPVFDKLIAICIATDNYVYDIENIEGFERLKSVQPEKAAAWLDVLAKCRSHHIPIQFVKRFDSGWYLRIKSAVIGDK